MHRQFTAKASTRVVFSINQLSHLQINETTIERLALLYEIIFVQQFFEGVLILVKNKINLMHHDRQRKVAIPKAQTLRKAASIEQLPPK